MVESYRNIKEIARWIADERLGRISDADREKLMRWRQASPRHEEKYQTYISAIWYADKFREQAAENMDVRYAVLRKRVANRRRRILFYRWVGVAVLMVLVGGGLLFNREEVRKELPVVAQKIMPGESKAVLTLSDGSEIVLSDSVHVLPLKEKGTALRVLSTGLRYEVEDSLENVGESYNTVTIPRGGEYTLTLSDGSVVRMNSESQIRYPVQFSGNMREVFMHGELFFEVAKDASRPFVIHADQGDIRVLGTSFNVRNYASEGFLETTLVNGKVAFEKEGKQYFLKPGEQLKLDKESGKTTIEQVDVRLYCSWIEGRFVFEAQRLETIMNAISRWYDVEVVYESEALKDILFTGSLKRYDELGPVLDMLVLVNKINIDVIGNKVFIKNRK